MGHVNIWTPGLASGQTVSLSVVPEAYARVCPATVWGAAADQINN